MGVSSHRSATSSLPTGVRPIPSPIPRIAPGAPRSQSSKACINCARVSNRRPASYFGYGVGLHAGPSLIGNIGSSQYFHYGPVGDLIHSAARIEVLTKHYGVLMIVTREVYSRLSAPPPARVLDHVIVKGKSTPLELIEVRHRFNADGFAGREAQYAAAFALYQRGEFAEAAAGFETLASLDKPSALLAERCRALAGDVPPGWNGIYKLDSK